MVVMSKRRFRIYGGWLLATVGLIVAACFAVNCLIDPLWYLRGNVLTGINYPFNERMATMVTVPSGASETKRWGSDRTPCGILSAPVE